MWKKLLLTSFIIFGMLSFSHAASVGDVKNYGYTGGVQSYTAPVDGTYKLEVWGAKGGNGDISTNGVFRAGGNGGYASGVVKLKKGDVLYIVAGQAGMTGSTDTAQNKASYNGGGRAGGGFEWYGVFGCYASGGAGGGATHIALNANRGELKNYASHQGEVLIVAGGGGGGLSDSGRDNGYYGGQAGNGSGGNSFGVGQNGVQGIGQATAGGGGGWAGGSSSKTHSNGGTSHTSSSLSSVTTKNGENSGNGKAKITIMSIIQTLTCPSASNKTYNGSSQTGMSCPTGSTPSGNCSATNAGGYTCTCTAKSGYTFNGSCSRYWTIGKANPKITAPTAKTLTYNESAQGLINAGSTTGGTIQYKVNNGGYSTSIPAGTNAGTYTVYYKVVGNTNYNDVAEKSITVSIARAKTATASASDKNYDGTEQTGVSGSYVTWTGTTKATNPNLYTATATPDSNHAWSDGTTTAKNLTWSILQNWNRYTIDCLTDSFGNPVQSTDKIISNEAYTIQKKNFDIKAQDVVTYTFCVGKNSSKSVVYYNGEQSGIYYWKNGTWTKK